MEIELLAELGPDRRRALFDRDAGIDEIREDVDRIIERVREQGDDALRDYAEEFDGVRVANLSLGNRLDRAVDRLDPELRAAIETAVENVRAYHRRQLREDWWMDVGDGRLGRRYRPIERVGAYVPGGTAAYPSSAIMTVVPAQVAGVEQVVVATPPGDPINDVTLAALHIAGADEVYQVGGAQAVGALAYGTETIPRVPKIVGPGNRWVTAAKAAVRNDVDVDMLAGPSEILIIADESAVPAYVAADLLAQAEHGPRSPCVLVTDDRAIAEAVIDELDAQLASLGREEIAREALTAAASGIFLARSMSEAIGFAETYAPEHLAIQTHAPETVLERIDSVGSAFLGPYTPVAAGDYASGTNHVLPTHGGARVRGGLSVDEFVRATSIQSFDPEGLEHLAPTVIALAEAEGLSAHAESVRVRHADDVGRGRQG